MFDIRIARVEDKESIRQIFILVAGAEPNRDEDYRVQLMQAGGLLVAETEGQIIGFGGIDVSAAEQIKWLYILPQYQRAGVGSEILRRLEVIGWKAGLDSLRVHSAPGAVEFYRRHDYRDVERDKQLGHDHEGVEMAKEFAFGNICR
jgi:ribosomal protein S18 acetylase RimI-like enzyme